MNIFKKKDEFSETNKTIKAKNKVLIIVLVSVAALLVILFCLTGFSLLNMGNSKILSKVRINGIEVAKLTKQEAMDLLTEKLNENSEKNITIKGNNFEYSMRLSQIETDYNIEKAVDEAYSIGRRGNIFENNFEILKTKMSGENINLDATYNEELLNGIVNDISLKVPDAVQQSNYYIEEDKLYISKGAEGNGIEEENVKKEIVDKIFNLEKDNIEIAIIKKQPENIDIEKIHEEIYKEPKDAYYTKEPFQVFQHENGVDFNLEQAKELLKEEKEIYEIELIITVPEITIDKIGTEAFPDLLSTFTTKFDSSNINRSTNLRLAAQAIDGTVLMPGEIFSYNKVVGERTAAKGYKPAHGFSGGKVVDMLGGGICQIASTLYDAAVYANLEIVDRTNHMFDPSYVSPGKDATVVYGSIDFKFKNTRKYPIMIKGSAVNGIAKMEIFGIKEDVEYEIEIVSNILSYTPFSVVYETDYSLPEGKEVVSQNGMRGMKSITYKIVKLNGVEVSKTTLSTDTYKAMNKYVRRGAAYAPAEPEPEPTPEPTPEPIPEPIEIPVVETPAVEE